MLSLSRRDWLRYTSGSAAALGLSPWAPALADAVASHPQRKRHCILLWMTGGPSQLDTFDLKPGHANGGEFKPIATRTPGLEISEHLPRLAKLSDYFAIVRSLSTKEGDHGRGTYLMRTGRQPGGPIAFPTIGSALSKELGSSDADLPNFVSIAPYRVFNRDAFGPGFLGPQHAPLTVAASDQFVVQAAPNADYAALGVDDLSPAAGLGADQVGTRLALWRRLQSGFVAEHYAASPIAQNTVYERAQRMMSSAASGAFDLSQETATVRDSYGRGRFGQGCLMARRLVERGVPFVEVSLGAFGNGTLAWDTHNNNFAAVKGLSAELDAGWSALMEDLALRGLLEHTTILWVGEFGRTPKINGQGGRDHYPNAWSCVLGGGGIRGGQVYGATSEDGMQVADNPASVEGVLATLTAALGVDPAKQNLSSIGRPIRIAEGKPIDELLAG